MGSNDHLPNVNGTKRKSRRQKSAELLDWGMLEASTLHALVAAASQASAYIAFGATVPPTCLLLYVRSGDWKERIAIESRDELEGTIRELIDEF